MVEPRPEDSKTEISCRAAKGIILFLRKVHGLEMLEEVFSRAALPVDYVNDGSNWLSFDAFNRLLTVLVEVTGDEEAPYKAGTQTSDPSTFGAVRVMGQRFLSIHGVYHMMAMHSYFFVKVCDWSMLARSAGHVQLEIRYRKGYEQTKNNCDNIRGHLSSIPVWLGAEPATVTHHACILRGGEVCVYDVQWVEEPSYRGAILGGVGGVLLATFGLIAPASVRSSSWLWGGLILSLGLAVAVLSLLHGRLRSSRRQHAEEADALMKATEMNEQLNAGLQSKVEARTRELRETNAQLKQAFADLEASREKALSAERQAAIGVLASGMAHDMNSPLNAIRLTLQAVAADLPPDAQLRSIVASAERASARCKRLVADLLAFSREPCMSADINLHKVAGKCLRIFDAESSAEVETTLSVEDTLPHLLLDEAQLQQAVLNLMTNASDAMDGKGRIDLLLKSGEGEVILEVRDNGPGMSEEVQGRVFEPFFTTKTTGRGHGLGLPITQQLIHRNGGSVELETQLGKGTTFRLRFPVCPATSSTTEGM